MVDELDRRELVSSFAKPVTPQELYTFLYLATGENIPSKRVCPDHQTPWDFCSSAFFNKYDSILAIGNRGGSKTRTVGKLIFAELYFLAGVEIAAIGAIESQAQRCYGYVKSFLEMAAQDKIKKTIRKLTVLNNGSKFEELVGTLAGVNSPHPQKLRADEVELMKPDVLDELLLAPISSTALNIPTNTTLTSTRKYNYGLVQRLVQDDTLGFHTFIWCYKEVAENCPIERRGVDKKKYIIRDHLNIDKRGNIPETEIYAWSNCGSCPLLPSCRGDLARADGYMPIQDLITKYKRSNPQRWIQQMECRLISAVGKIYPQFDELIHAAPIDYNPNLPVDISIDFGFSHPCSVGFWQEDEDKPHLYLFDELYETGLTIEMLAIKIKEKLKEYKLTPAHVRYGVADPARPEAIKELNDKGFSIEQADKGAGSVLAGIDVVREYLYTEEYGSRITMNRSKCPNHIKEFKDYHAKMNTTGSEISEDPVKRNDDACDETRYYVTFIESMSGGDNIHILG